MSNFNDTNYNFEEFLSQEANKYRVYPSDKVWNNIRTEMQGKKRWPALIFFFVFVMLAATISTVIFYPPHKEYLILPKEKSANKIAQADNKQGKSSFASIAIENSAEKVNKEYVAGIVQSNKIIKQKSVYTTNNKTNATVATYTIKNTLEKELVVPKTVALVTKSNSNFLEEQTKNINQISLANSLNTSIKDLETNKATTNYVNTSAAIKKSSSKKLQLQFYVAPSVSYRVLEDDKSRASYTSNPTDLQALKNNVNDVVHHKPAFGSEVGLMIMYPITKNIFIKTGLQFNASQYIVDASEQSGNANISFVQNNQLNTVSYQAKYSTKQGTDDVMLDNKVYQLSVPLGLQWNFIDNARWGVAIGATIQPTITLNKNIYLVSTDYKYYTDGAPFFRKTNINTTTELLFTLKSGGNKWIFGPQIRYQQMPTYNDLYPIKEHRVDYGIKVGFIKSL